MLSICGVNCSKDCLAFRVECEGCNELDGKVSWVLLKRILNADIFPVIKAIDDSLREKIEAYLWQSTLEKPELKWLEKYKK